MTPRLRVGGSGGEVQPAQRAWLVPDPAGGRADDGGAGVTALSAGKLRGMRRLADAEGCFSMVAVDQRPPIMGHLQAVQGSAPDAVAATVKRALLQGLGPAASAFLCDPIWAYPFAHDLLAPTQGLIAMLEDHCFEDTPGGRGRARSRAGRSRKSSAWAAME